MWMYVFRYISELTNNYHSGGGLIVIAGNTRESVQELLDIKSAKSDSYEGLQSDFKLSDDDWKRVEKFELKEDVEPRVYIFPDAGCC